MVLTEINSDQFRDMVRAATHRMGKNAEFVNKLNVFPVPDGLELAVRVELYFINYLEVFIKLLKEKIP